MSSTRLELSLHTWTAVPSAWLGASLFIPRLQRCWPSEGSWLCQWLIRESPRVGWDWCILCSSNYRLNESSALVQVGRDASRETPASQGFINHLLLCPILLCTQRWKTGFVRKNRIKGQDDFYLMTAAWACIRPFWSTLSRHRGPHLSWPQCTDNLILAHLHHILEWMD